ncbi:MAG: dNTP triphosphohydrolase [Anaerovoracaceae bacterium]
MGIVYIIKNKLDSKNPTYNKSILERAVESFKKEAERYYNTNLEDGKCLYELSQTKASDGIIMLVSYLKEGQIDTDDYSKCEMQNIYIGQAELCNDQKEEKACNIKYRMKRCLEYPPVMINMLDGLELSLGDDFNANSYLLVSESVQFFNMVMDYISEGVAAEKKEGYEETKTEYELSKYAQHNEYCVRMYGLLKEDSRSEFQRDRERIVNSKAFRRLVDKAQIFSAEKGDHYRTRMTHTLEVNQIAKAISYSLNLNLDLTEAIALGHDLGHTPFGHQGERTLRDIVAGEKLEGIFNIDRTLFNDKLFGGFKHNFQSVRVLTCLEEKYVEYEGLDISLQTLEGILKHTKLKDAELGCFINKDFIKELHMEQDFSSSLEGQVVAVADEIAQRGHDIDDAITSGLLTIDELIEALSTNKFSDLQELLLKEKNSISEKKRLQIDNTELTIARIISCIVGFLIDDIVETSRKYINTKLVLDSKGIYAEQAIKFSENKGQIYCEFLEKVVNKKVIGNSEVARFDYNAEVIITKLFKAYYNNPKLLHRGTLRKNYIDQLRHEDNRISLRAIDLENGNIKVVRNEIKRITQDAIKSEMTDEEIEILEKRKILVRNIVDYLAGMTDSYAINEYEKIK